MDPWQRFGSGKDQLEQGENRIKCMFRNIAPDLEARGEAVIDETPEDDCGMLARSLVRVNDVELTSHNKREYCNCAVIDTLQLLKHSGPLSQRWVAMQPVCS